MKNKTIQTEVDACFLYQKLAEHEKDAVLANVFRQMSDIEKSHAEAFAKKENTSLAEFNAAFVESKNIKHHW